MEFTIQQRKHPNLPKYPTEELTLGREFAIQIHKELGEFLKAAVLFGSAARHTQSNLPQQTNDIDVLLLINDLTIIASEEVITAYRVIVSKTAGKVSSRLHINTLKLTTFWDYIRMGDPIVINMLRDGIPLYDNGLFEPLQYLLFQGRIRPTKEAMWTYYSRAPMTIQSAEWHVLQATTDLYWAVIDAAHAALIKIGEVPPTPGHVHELLQEKLAKKNLISKKAASTMHMFYDLNKKITHKEITHLTGEQYEHYLKLCREFVAEMRKVLELRLPV